MLNTFTELYARLLTFFQLWVSTPRQARNITSVAASIVGQYHQGKNRPNEDACGCIENSGNHAFFVVDGAGGEAYGKLASTSIEQHLRHVLPRLLGTWSDEQEACIGMKQLLVELNDIAYAKGGKASCVIFISFANGHWALAHVGDAVFVGLDRWFRWIIPINPNKFTPRNMTTLLGGSSSLDSQSPVVVTGQDPFTYFFITSDWICSSSRKAPIFDIAPNGFIGIYKPDWKILNRLVKTLMPSGKMLAEDELTAFLEQIRSLDVTWVVETRDDMSLIFGKVED